MFPIMSQFAAEDEAYVRGVVPDFTQFGKVLQVQQCSAAKVETASSASSYFYKKSSVQVLQKISPRNSDDKWRVTLASFVNEHVFLGDAPVLQALRQGGVVGVPKVIHLDQSSSNGSGAGGGAPDFSTVFRTLLEYLDPVLYREERRYDTEEDARAMLRWLAAFHGFFWEDGSTEHKQQSRFLETGGWWRKPLRPTVKFHAVLSTVQHLSKHFPGAFASALKTEEEEDSSCCWEEMAACKQRDAFRLQMGPARTLIHGDCKSSNFFFKREESTPLPLLHVTGIDFQWVGGAATGAGDVVYLLFGSVTRVWEREEQLKQWYFDSFQELQQQKARSISRKEFDLQYELELLDYFTTVCPYLLAELTPKRMVKNATKYGYLTYEDDERALTYFFQRAARAWRTVRHLFEDDADAAAISKKSRVE